ncbi:hypothetical protein [Actinomadura formosensis]|uniref:hypothetical protein n=1 Tax=Actinomadura formosensis TaxID=60706 RepID=UPI000ACBE024|nr:hypothetical protein [Actinomadura formosensis]
MLITLDKLDKLWQGKVAAELVDVRSLAPDIAEALVGDLSATDAVERMHTALQDSEAGRAGLDEVGGLLELASPKAGDDRIARSPRVWSGAWATAPVSSSRWSPREGRGRSPAVAATTG